MGECRDGGVEGGEVKGGDGGGRRGGRAEGKGGGERGEGWKGVEERSEEDSKRGAGGEGQREGKPCEWGVSVCVRVGNRVCGALWELLGNYSGLYLPEDNAVLSSCLAYPRHLSAGAALFLRARQQ